MRILRNVGLELRKAKQRIRRLLLEKTEVRPMDFTAFTADLVDRVSPHTLTPPERIHSLELAVRHVAGRGIPGAFVECGVWRGGSMMAVAYVLMDEGVRDRDLVLFDTFEGMTEPTAEDVSWSGKTALPSYAKRLEGGESQWMRAELDLVEANLYGTGYPRERIRFVKGPVEETLPDEGIGDIALLRLDTDWYSSTKVELEHLFPRLVPGGILLVDDYGRWKGQRQAVDEYLAGNDIDLFLARIDEYSRIGVKR